MSSDNGPVTRPVLTLDDLHVRYGGSHVLQGVSFEVPPTGVTALLGRNGVGKTTTLKAVIGLAPRTGRILMRGHEIQGLSTTRIIRGGIGYVPEDREVFGGLTVDENLRLVDPERGVEAPSSASSSPTWWHDAGSARAHSRAASSRWSRSPGSCCATTPSCSSTSRPRAWRPKLVTEVADVLAEVARTTPILLVEQNLPLVRRIADRVVVLDAGEVVHRGAAADLVADAALTRELLGVSMRRDGAA